MHVRQIQIKALHHVHDHCAENLVGPHFRQSIQSPTKCMVLHFGQWEVLPQQPVHILIGKKSCYAPLISTLDQEVEAMRNQGQLKQILDQYEGTPRE